MIATSQRYLTWVEYFASNQLLCKVLFSEKLITRFSVNSRADSAVLPVPVQYQCMIQKLAPPCQGPWKE